MRSVRLAAFALVGAALTACSNDVTAPSRATPAAPALDVSCRTGFLLSTGRCSDGSSPSKAPKAGTTPTITTQDGCRTGFLLSTGRCSDEE